MGANTGVVGTRGRRSSPCGEGEGHLRLKEAQVQGTAPLTGAKVIYNGKAA